MDAVDNAVALLDLNVGDHPQSADARFGLGRAYRTQGHEAEAIEQFQQAIELDPNHARTIAALVD